jgi:hypothetical protein
VDREAVVAEPEARKRDDDFMGNRDNMKPGKMLDMGTDKAIRNSEGWR